MTWNYRIVKYKDGSGYGLHEVYYDEDGKPDGMTEEPANFICDSDEEPKDAISTAVSMALKDALDHPVLEEPEEWQT